MASLEKVKQICLKNVEQQHTQMNSYLESAREFSMSKFKLARSWFAPDTLNKWEKSCVHLGLRNSQVSSWWRKILVLWEPWEEEIIESNYLF